MSDSSSLADKDIIIIPRVYEFYLPAGYIRRMLSDESDTASVIMSALERLLEIERLCAQLQAARQRGDFDVESASPSEGSLKLSHF